jgi:hypothetical protein
MLLLTTLFTVVAGIFLYSLRSDTGKHTKHARAKRDMNRNKSENTASTPTHSLQSGSTDSARAA